LVRACGSYPQRPGFESLHRHQIEAITFGGGLRKMKKLFIWATAGLFALSLQGSALAQKEERAPEAMPPVVESPTPVAPAEMPAAPEKVEKTAKKKSQLKTKKKTKNKRAKKKKTKKAKKKAV
jgi:hypothetical protein